jgi:hypothetical protein
MLRGEGRVSPRSVYIQVGVRCQRAGPAPGVTAGTGHERHERHRGDRTLVRRRTTAGRATSAASDTGGAGDW